MFLSMLQIETYKTRKHPAFWLGLSALALMLALLTFANAAQIRSGYAPESGGLAQYLLSGLFYVNFLGVLVYAVSAAVIAAFDYPDRSLQLWLNHGVPRSLLMAARMLTILLFGFLLVTLMVLLLLGFSVMAQRIFFGEVAAMNMNWAAFPGLILRMFWSALPYLSLTLLCAVISRSALIAAVSTILYGTVLENLLLHLGDDFGRILQYLPAKLTQVLQFNNYTLDHAATLTALPVSVMTPSQAALAIGIISLILSGISLLIFSRQDLGG